jgi:hypothetical protein
MLSVDHPPQEILWTIFAKVVLPQEFKPAYLVDHRLLQHLDALEQAAEKKRGAQQALAYRCAKAYTVSLPLAAYGLRVSCFAGHLTPR